MRDRRLGWVVLVIAIAGLALRHPSADIRVFAHDADDPAPHRLQAAIDLGLVGVSVLVTWTAKRLT